MDIFEEIHHLSLNGEDTFALLVDELPTALNLFWTTADRVLKDSGISLLDPPEGFLDLENNFFSALFLYSYHRADIPKPRRIMYAAINHCLRGMVTGCDNILDNEYKKILETSLPEAAVRLRSIIDIMVSDRVTFEILFRNYLDRHLTYDQVLAGSIASLHALTDSGIQEADEEAGGFTIMTPEEVIHKVHHYKTGSLFLCPWGVPRALEGLPDEQTAPIRDALYRIGLGCQIMDDMVDLAVDVLNGHQNYLASQIYHLGGPHAFAKLEARSAEMTVEEAESNLLLEFPEAQLAAAKVSRRFMEGGTRDLFEKRHQTLVEPAIGFFCRRIRTDLFMSILDTC